MANETKEITQIEEIEKQQKEEEEKVEKESEEEVEDETGKSEKITEEEITKDSKEKSKKPKKEKTGILHIYTSQNNTILTITDLSGNTIARSSGGQSTKQDRLKSSPTVAMFAAKKIGEEAKELGVVNLYARIKAQTGSDSIGSASHAVIKSLSRDGFKILNIIEVTRQPRGGPKKKGGRRGRRV